MNCHQCGKLLKTRDFVKAIPWPQMSVRLYIELPDEKRVKNYAFCLGCGEKVLDGTLPIYYREKK